MRLMINLILQINKMYFKFIKRKCISSQIISCNITMFICPRANVMTIFIIVNCTML